MPPRRFAALRSMDGFHCIGAECEDNCCHYWKISVDQSTHQRLKKAMAKDPADAELFQRAFRLVPPAERTRDSFAVIPDASLGECTMLDGGLCTIHGRYGEAFLPAVCATYPRRVAIVGERAELTGSLSCPEVARRALLVDGGGDVVEAAPSLFGDPRIKRVLNPEKAHAYEAQIDEIRGTLLQFLALGQYPLASRLYFGVVLGERVSSFFNEKSDTTDQALLAEEIAGLELASTKDSLHERFAATPTDGPLAISVLAQALAARLLHDRVPRTNDLVNAIMAEYAADGGVRAQGDGIYTLSPEPLWTSYHRRWQTLREHHGERLERWFKNYCQHTLFHDWYCDMPTLSAYMQRLALQLALTRFLLAGHPLVAEGLRQNDAGLLDRALVAVVYTLARSFDHSALFLDAMARVMAETFGPATTVALLKV